MRHRLFTSTATAMILVLSLALGAQAQPAAVAEAPQRVKLKTIVVTETAGLARSAWPVLVSLTLTPEEAQSVKQWVLMPDPGAQPIAFQVLDTLAPEYVTLAPPTAGSLPATQPTLMKVDAPKQDFHLVEIAFLADLPAHADTAFALYRVKAGETAPTPAPAAKLAIAGSGLGLSVDSGPVKFTFDPASGQLMTYTPKLAGFNQEIGFTQMEPRPFHWNPDVYSLPQPWGHTSDWDIRKPERSYEYKIAQGPLVFRSVRYGTMPTSNGVFASVTYTAFAGMPFVLESSLMRFTHDTKVEAVRANELVFNRGLHDHVAWREAMDQGEVKTVLCYDPAEPKKFRNLVARMEPDIPWIMLYNQDKGYGIGYVNLARLEYSPTSLIDPQSHTTHYYVNDYGEHGTQLPNYNYNFLYICRPSIFHRTIVPRDAIFAEHSVILVAGLDKAADKRFQSVDQWARLLRHPVRVVVK